MRFEDALDELYAQALSDFITTRNALAKSLDADDSKRLKALKKPSLVVWTLNQLARRHPDNVAELIAAAERLRGAQRRAASGGAADELREAQAERRRMVARLAKAAGSVLSAGGHAAAPATLKKIDDSLFAAATDEDGASLLAAGRLDRELVPSGFVDVGGLEVLPGEGEAAEAPKPDLKAVEPTVDEEEVGRAKAALEEAEASAVEASAVASEAEAEAEELTQHARELELAANAVRREAKLARQRAKALREDADAAKRAEADCRTTLDDLNG